MTNFKSNIAYLHIWRDSIHSLVHKYLYTYNQINCTHTLTRRAIEGWSQLKRHINCCCCRCRCIYCICVCYLLRVLKSNVIISVCICTVIEREKRSGKTQYKEKSRRKKNNLQVSFRRKFKFRKVYVLCRKFQLIIFPTENIFRFRMIWMFTFNGHQGKSCENLSYVCGIYRIL